MKNVPLQPLGDRVILEQLEAEEKTASGIVLPGQSQEKPQAGTVLAVGPGALVDGKRTEMCVKIGDKVIFQKYAANNFKVDKEEYVIVKQDDILAIIK